MSEATVVTVTPYAEGATPGDRSAILLSPALRDALGQLTDGLVRTVQQAGLDVGWSPARPDGGDDAYRAELTSIAQALDTSILKCLAADMSAHLTADCTTAIESLNAAKCTPCGYKCHESLGVVREECPSSPRAVRIPIGESKERAWVSVSVKYRFLLRSPWVAGS